MKAADLVKILAFYGRFTPTYSRIGYTARKLGWSSANMNFTGQHWLVTGASGGIGAAIATGAAKAGATVLAVARNPAKLQTLTQGLDSATAGRISLGTCDLASVAAIDEFLGGLRKQGETFNVVVNNVGVLFNELSTTDEGFEATYVTNLLGQFQLTEGLFEAKLLGSKPLILNMASGGLYNVPRTTKLLNVTDPRRYGGKAAYAAHKRGQAALSELWDQRLKDVGGRSYVMHPGWVRTEGVRQSLPTFYKIQGLILRTPAEGADTALWLAAQRPEEGGHTIWFDRAVRPQHVFAHTHTAQCTEQELYDYVNSDLEKARESLSSH
ncbi:MAG: SDR family NAD(P)-dependent oxidoreductase [Congregibacter sp.]